MAAASAEWQNSKQMALQNLSAIAIVHHAGARRAPLFRHGSGSTQTMLTGQRPNHPTTPVHPASSAISAPHAAHRSLTPAIDGRGKFISSLVPLTIRSDLSRQVNTLQTKHYRGLSTARQVRKSKTVTYKAVIFDFGGVFTTSPVHNFTVYERQHGLPEKFIGGVIKARLHDGAFARFERSEMTREEFNFAFADETKKAGHRVDGETLLSLLTLDLYPEMIDALVRVKAAGYRTGCITNNMATHDSASMTQGHANSADITKIFSHFDHVIESSKVGVRKPEPRIYHMMCDALGLPPSACIFLDDLGVNLKPARAMGMATIKVPIGNVTPAIDELFSLTGV